jgi:hypothetical protein
MATSSEKGTLMSVLEMTRPEPALNGKLMRPRPAASTHRILAVWFCSTDGRDWNTIGGGATVAAAIIDARESCPNDTTWEALSWNDLYGD